MARRIAIGGAAGDLLLPFAAPGSRSTAREALGLFVNANTGTVVGSERTILRTTTGGE